MKILFCIALSSMLLLGCKPRDSENPVGHNLLPLVGGGADESREALIARFLLCEVQGDYRGALEYVTQGSRDRAIARFGNIESLVISYQNMGCSLLFFDDHFYRIKAGEKVTIQAVVGEELELRIRNERRQRVFRYLRANDGIESFECYMVIAGGTMAQIVYVGVKDDRPGILLPLPGI